MSLYLCVDCGGSKTAAAIASADGKIIGRALAGPSNFAYLGRELFVAAVTTAVSAALQTCTTPSSETSVPLPPAKDGPQFAAACFGISGVDSPAAIATLTAVLSDLLDIPAGPRLVVSNDTNLLAAPLRLHKDVSYAVTAIAGTGSCVTSFKQQPDGQLEELGRVGGWGWILGDEGGGFHVGREAIRQILLEDNCSTVSGAPPTTNGLTSGKASLKDTILKHFHADEPMELLTIIHLPDPTPSAEKNESVPEHMLFVREKRLSSLAPLVFTSAFDDEDPLALKVLQITSAELAQQIAIVLDQRLGGKAVKAEESVICFGGSLVRVQRYRKMILEHLERMGHVFRYVEFVDDAAATGALSLTLAGGP